MPFDQDAFDAAQVNFKTQKVPVPLLKKFFDDDETPEFEIKSLTGVELAIVEESPGRIKILIAALESFAENTVKGFKDGFEELLNGDIETPETYLRWITLVRLGTVPQLPEHIVVKMAFSNGGVLKRLAYKISVMSAIGADLGE
ncbi:MAG: hypothetical protein QM498_01830 [Desulfobacterium sp.]